MSIYAISDLHLSLGASKPMDIFGEAWKNHDRRIAENWDAMVRPSDTVLLVGDHSWALKFQDARLDLEYIAQRPGHKIMVRGNHDYWWRREATNRMQKEVDESIYLMHGRGIVVENVGITGTRGWRIEAVEDPDAGDERVLRRELMYLERGLKEIPSDVECRIAMLHYPPFNADMEPNEFAKLLRSHSVDILVYGHIHTGAYLEGHVDSIDYRLVSADHTDFSPIKIIQSGDPAKA